MRRIILLFVFILMILTIISCGKSKDNADNKISMRIGTVTNENNNNHNIEDQNNVSNTHISDNIKIMYDDNLCLPGERIVFSFIVKDSQKRISICISEDEDYIVYRTGTLENIEFEFPEEKENSWDNFSFSFYLRGGGMENSGLDLNNIVFTYGDNSFDIYEEYSAEDDSTSVGVIIKDIIHGHEDNVEGDPDSIIGSLNEFRWNDKIKKN